MKRDTMKITETQLRRIIREEARKAREVSPKVIAAIQSVVDAYSSITDSDMEALEELGFFDYISKATSAGIPLFRGYPDWIPEGFDHVLNIKPLVTALKSETMPSVDTMEAQLVSWAQNDRRQVFSRYDESDLVLRRAAKGLLSLIAKARKEHERLMSKAEADPDAPLGRIAFAPARKGVPYEPNNELEKEMSSALGAHFEGQMVDNETLSLIRSFMDQGLYSKLFFETRAPVVYRGMNVTTQSGAKWLQSVVGGDLKGQGVAKVDYSYTQRDFGTSEFGGASSWSTSREVTQRFLSKNAKYHIIMHARPSDNPGQFLSTEGLYGLDFVSSAWKDEKEAIGFGTITVF